MKINSITTSLCLIGTVSCAQSLVAVEDDQISDLWRQQSGVSATSDMRRAKRKELRNGAWVHSMGLDVQAGYIDNVFISPSAVGAQTGLEESSTLLSVGAYWKVERNFDKNRSLDIEVAASSMSFSESSDASGQSYACEISYDQDLHDDVTWESSLDIDHATDDATDVFGDPYTRDFAYFSYQLRTGVDWDINKQHKLSVSVTYKMKDYSETTGMNSIDWNDLSTRLSYRWRINDQFKLRAQYDYGMQAYDEEPANNAADGLESLGNPNEEHVFNKLTLSAYWYPKDGSKAWLKLATRNKTDDYEGFESYDETQMSIGVSSRFLELWYVKAELRNKDRDYDKRPGTGFSDTLVYDQQQLDVTLRRNLDEHQSVYVNYALAERSSNRDFGSVYRDYLVNSLSLGYSLNY